MKNDSRSNQTVKGGSRTRVSGKLVPAVERAVAILDRLSGAEQTLSLSLLARELGLPKSSVHGLCHTLCALRLLRPQGNGYVLGAHVLHWSQAFLATTDVVKEFHRLLAHDHRVGDHTVTLSCLDGADVVYLACRNSAAPLGFNFRIGMRLPAIYAATGKAMLARLGEQALIAALPKPWPPTMTKNSVGTRARLLAELAQVRQRGYALDDGQIRDGMVCLGAAICDANEIPVAGIAVSMTSTEATSAVIARTGAAMVAIGRELSQRI